MEHFNVIVIGAGVGGYTAAIRLAQYGKKVAIIEREEAGGVCLNKGCIPTKALLHAASLYRLGNSGTTRRSGIEFKGASINLEKLRKWRFSVSMRLSKGLLYLFKQYNIEYVKGEASFKDDNIIAVGERTLKGEQIILATGSKPLIPPVRLQNYWTSYDALSVSEIPESLLIVGGGVIGVELATVYALLGTSVTIVEMMDDILPFMDRDLREIKRRELKKMGVKILTSSKLISHKDGLALIERKEGNEEFSVSKVMIAAGRIPNSEIADTIGLEKDGRFVKVNNNFETSKQAIFAIGDLIKGPMLAHRAHKDGIGVANYIAGKSFKKNMFVPAVVYGEISLVTIGKTEDELIEKGIDYKKGMFPLAANGRSLTMESTEGFCKVLGSGKNGEIYGIHIAGVGVDELSGEVSLAMNNGLKIEDIANTIHAHPTLSESIMEASEHFYRMSIHIPNK